MCVLVADALILLGIGIFFDVIEVREFFLTKSDRSTNQRRATNFLLPKKLFYLCNRQWYQRKLLNL